MAKTRTSQQPVGIFILDNDAVFPWNIYVHVPNPNKPGEKQKFKLPVEFKHVTPERRQEILETWRDHELERARIGTEEAIRDTDDVETLREIVSFERAMLNEAVHRFPNVLGPDGKQLPDTDETKQAVLSNAWAISAALPAYRQFLSGLSAEGN